MEAQNSIGGEPLGAVLAHLGSLDLSWGLLGLS